MSVSHGSKRPNILFVFTDQHRYDFASFAGHEIVQTPNLDGLAVKGVVFNNAYCQNPLCVPSRSSMLTGKYSKNIGIYENSDILEPTVRTFPELLGEKGYRTCLIGKAHFNGEQYHGYQQRPYGDIFGQAHQPDSCRDDSESGLGDMVENSGVSGIPLPLTQTEICVSETTKWLQEHVSLYSEKPFLLSVHFDKPHFPIRAPEKYCSHYRGRISPWEISKESIERQVPFVQKAIRNFASNDMQSATRALEVYCACIEWVDDAIGRILNVLDYLQLREDTIVIYSSDHGELGGQHGAWNKTLFFDASSKVPLIISYPKSFRVGRTNELVSLVDLFPTLCSMAQVQIPADCDGINLMPLLEENQSLKRNEIFCESAFLGDPQHAGCMIRQENWKYNYYLDGTEELYNMEKDPFEENNLAILDKTELEYLKNTLKERLIEFWSPELQPDRIKNTPKVRYHKHCYKYSNQFINGNGVIFDAMP